MHLRAAEHGIERQVQLEHVDARPSQNAERRRFRVITNQPADALGRDAARRRHARRLQRRGRTTAAALEVLMAKDGMQPLMIRAIAAATKRSKELAK